MKLDFTILIGEIRELARRYPDTVQTETVQVLNLVEKRLVSAIVEKTPAGVGGAAGLRGSIDGDVVPFGGGVVMTVGTPLDYAEVVEEGRRPGTYPPVAPLAMWAERILGAVGAEARAAGFAIARKIYLEGTEGAHMFEKAWEENEKWAMDQLQTIPGKVVARLGRGTT